jgi:hypothetical protein
MSQNQADSHATPGQTVSPHELVASNIENGLVLNRRGRWVSIEEALVEEIRIRHHLEKGELLVNRQWVSIESQSAAAPAAGAEQADPSPLDQEQDGEEVELDTRKVATLETRATRRLQTGEGSTDDDGEQADGEDAELARKTVRLSANGELELTDGPGEAEPPEGAPLPTAADRSTSPAAAAPSASQPVAGPTPSAASTSAAQGEEEWELAADRGRRWQLLGIIAAALALAAGGWLVVEKLF